MTDIPIPEFVRRLEENLASFDAEVAYQLSIEGERADLWGEIDVNVEDLRSLLSDRAAQAERMARLEEALRHVRSATYYPVSTEINPKGWSWHMGPDGQEFVVETIESAIGGNADA